VSVIAEAENRNNTRAYHTVWYAHQTGDTTKAPLSRWYNESSIIDARRPNNDGVYAMTSIEHFVRKRIAVNPQHTLAFGVSQHQPIERCKMALAFGWFLQLQCLKEGSYLQW
jgi:hypothetical protein